MQSMTETAERRQTKVTKSSLSSIRRRENWLGWLFAAPAILGFIIFVLGPMIASLWLSLTDYKVASTPNFVGLDNYQNLFNGTDAFFYKSLGVTLYYVILSVPLQIIVAFFLAILLNQNVKGLAFFRTAFYLPTIVPLIASSMVWLWLFDPDMGLLNVIMRALHLPESQWIYSETTVVPTLVLMSLWTVGGTMVIFLAGLKDIPDHYYEAIEIDGGNALHKLIYITIPLTSPTIFFNTIMGFIGGFQVFVQPYVMTQGGPNNGSLFYIFYLFREAFTFSNMGYACAIAWVLFIVIMIFTFLLFRTSQKWVYYEGEGR
ncbi:carbohydrate ABC transporter permease [Paenibacillus wulumuqiensis]|uniref:carbohydrate ABC transporter permease n=1 Tax=Paenibacillus wulumuqiensis TaxID=1567107 RepID=UPI0006199C8C|nr:sugar ABC transporter permease [Paenibacillus wulumuqiensis]